MQKEKTGKTQKVNSLKGSSNHSLVITRDALKSTKAVYIARANKKIKYPWGDSFIAYIGETTKGVDRIAASAAERSQEVLNLHGFKELTFYTITCGARQNVKTWEVLEKSLIIVFREKYGEVPLCNTQGNKYKQEGKSKYFKEDRLKKLISKYSETSKIK